MIVVALIQFLGVDVINGGAWDHIGGDLWWEPICRLPFPCSDLYVSLFPIGEVGGNPRSILFSCNCCVVRFCE